LESAFVDPGKLKKKLGALKSRLRQAHVCQTFQNKDQLAAYVAADLGREFAFEILRQVSPDGARTAIKSVPEWTATRNNTYASSRNVFLAHSLRRSKKRGGCVKQSV